MKIYIRSLGAQAGGNALLVTLGAAIIVSLAGIWFLLRLRKKL